MTTRFRLNLPGFTIELEGQKTFVEDMYRAISRDLEPMLEAAAKNQPIQLPNMPSTDETRSASNYRRVSYTWVYLCTTLFNKVYVVENNVVENTTLGRFIDVDRVRRVYVDHATEVDLFKNLADRNRTLWAEFTDEGRALLKKTLAEHAEGSR